MCCSVLRHTSFQRRYFKGWNSFSHMEKLVLGSLFGLHFHLGTERLERVKPTVDSGAQSAVSRS